MSDRFVLRGLAQRLLDRGMHENALDGLIGCCALDELHLAIAEDLRVDGDVVCGQHRCGREVFALFLTEAQVGRGRQPNVHIEPDLMAGVASEHRAAAGL